MNRWELLLTLAAANGLAANVIAQIVIFRLAPQSVGLLKSLVGGFLVGGVAIVALTILAATRLHLDFPDLQGNLLLNGLAYFALGYGYFHFINLGETARRVRLLREFVECGEPMSREAILARYNARGIVEARLGRLLRNRQVRVRESDQRYVLGDPSVLRMAKILELMKLVLLKRATELDREIDPVTRSPR